MTERNTIDHDEVRRLYMSHDNKIVVELLTGEKYITSWQIEFGKTKMSSQFKPYHI